MNFTLPYKSKTLIYTCNYGNYDNVTPIDSDCDCIIFSDVPVSVKGWANIVQKFDFNNRRASRYLKINSHLLGYDRTLYIDARSRPKKRILQKDIERISEDYLISSFHHTKRHCTYQEIQAVKQNKFDDLELLEDIKHGLKIIGFPENYGLSENGFLIRNNCKTLKRFERAWWNNYFSQRDQISFMFTCWAYDIYPNFIKFGNVWNNEFFEIKHR